MDTFFRLYFVNLIDEVDEKDEISCGVSLYFLFNRNLLR